MGGKFLSTLKKSASTAGDILNSKGDILTRTASALARLAVGSDGKVLTAKSSESTGLSWETPTVYDVTQSFVIACSDETTALTTGTNKARFRLPYAFTLSAVRASVNTAPVGSTLTVDINEAGSTILSTKITIDASETTSVSAATAPVISDTSLADDAIIGIDIDQIGSSTAGAGLKVVLIGTKT